MVIETQKFINLGALWDFDNVRNQRQVGSKFLNHDDEEEKTDGKANMVYSYWIFFLSFDYNASIS